MHSSLLGGCKEDVRLFVAGVHERRRQHSALHVDLRRGLGIDVRDVSLRKPVREIRHDVGELLKFLGTVLHLHEQHPARRPVDLVDEPSSGKAGGAAVQLHEKLLQRKVLGELLVRRAARLLHKWQGKADKHRKECNREYGARHFIAPNGKASSSFAQAR